MERPELNLILISGIAVASYYGFKNKDPRLLALAGIKLLSLVILNANNQKADNTRYLD